MKKYKPEMHQFSTNEESSAYIKSLPSSTTVIDCHKDMVYEKYLIDNPKIYFLDSESQMKRFNKYYKSLLENNYKSNSDLWIYLPWINLCVHTFSQEEYMLLRTARNRGLISEKDQKILYNQSVAVIGLSVGLNVLNSLVRLGIGNQFILADSDKVSISNINRSIYSLPHLNNPKCDIAVETVSKVDPFLTIEVQDEGLREKDIEDIVMRSSIIIDTFDSFGLKIKLRKVAKSYGVPIISCFDIDKGVLLIVERYDSDKDLDIQFFLNGHAEEEFYKNNVSIKEKTNFFINLIGRDYHSDSMLEAVYKVGTELTGYPQLIIATSFAASLLTYAAEEILLNKPFNSIRKYCSLSEILAA